MVILILLWAFNILSSISPRLDSGLEMSLLVHARLLQSHGITISARSTFSITLSVGLVSSPEDHTTYAIQTSRVRSPLKLDARGRAEKKFN